MKNYCIPFSFLIAPFANAQVCTPTGLALPPEVVEQWIDADLCSDGNIAGLVAVVPELFDALAVMTTPDGQLLWERYIATTNPQIRLFPRQVVAMADGGMAVFGYTEVGPTWYEHNFIVRLRADGTIQWARYYMKNNSASYDWSRTSVIAALPDGKLLLALARSNGISAIRLDEDGVPEWHRRYAPRVQTGFGSVTGHDVSIAPDGSMIFMGAGTQGELWLCRTDATGEVLMSRQYNGIGAWKGHLLLRTNGDLITYGSQGLHQFTSAGTWQWGWATNVDDGVVELADEDLVVHGTYMDVWRLDPDGALQNAWSASDEFDDAIMVSARGDSIRILGNSPWNEGELVTYVLPSAIDLDCIGSDHSPLMNEHPGWSSITDSSYVYTDSVKTWTMSCGVPPELTQRDLTGWIYSSGARPGFDVCIFGTWENLGGLPSGPVTVTMALDPQFDFISATPAPNSTSGNVLVWEFPGIQGFSDGPQFLNVLCHAPAELPLGTPWTSSISIASDSTDSHPANNTVAFNSVLVASIDPNDKLVRPNGSFHIANDTILDYVIRFQNTGTAEAIDVVLVDTLPVDLDITTFRVLGASHPYTYSLTGNGILTFTFENILLPDSNTNEPLSHGLVNFSIRPILPLQLGQVITNAADIYFDFNEPIRTPNATVVVTDETGVRPLVNPAQLVVYPVPVRNTVTAVLPEGFKPVQAFAVGTDGRRVPILMPPSCTGQVQLATQHLPPGAYVLTLRAQDGRRLSARFVKD